MKSYSDVLDQGANPSKSGHRKADSLSLILPQDPSLNGYTHQELIQL